MSMSSVNIRQLPKLRPHGTLEQFSSARHYLGFYNNVGILAAYSWPALSPADLKAAILSSLATAIERHPILSAIVADEDTHDPYFARLPEINLENAVTFLIRQVPVTENGRDVELDSILEVQHNPSFKQNYGNLSCWRLIIISPNGKLNEFVAAFIFHHSLEDGGSGLVFHRSLLSALKSCTATLKINTMTPPNN